nr:hypothetical protein [Bacillus cereus]
MDICEKERIILEGEVPAYSTHHLAVAAAGFAVSVGLTYFTEGVKWDVDLDGDGEDDSIKDMVKTGAKKAWSTVAGWFN